MPADSTRFGLVRMVPRDPAQPGRAVSNLELLFDLVFAVAVGVSSDALHSLEADGRLIDGVGAYLMVFFAIWWAWMNFTWFATSFDTDDWLYRLMVIVQMAGALIIATGAKAGIEHGDFTWVVVGYVVLRVITIGQWIRVAIANPDYRQTATRYAVSIACVQVLWILRQPLLPPALQLPSFLVMVALELLIPVFAESARSTPWHSRHIADRFGAFTLILLGESVLASANAVLAAIDEADRAALIGIAGCGLVIIAGMWWIYFASPTHELVTGLRSSLTFGYFHFVIFASAGAFSAGIENAIGELQHPAQMDGTVVRVTLSVPVALFLLAIWALALWRSQARWANLAIPAAIVVIGFDAFSSLSLPITAAGTTAIVIILEVGRDRRRIGVSG